MWIDRGRSVRVWGVAACSGALWAGCGHSTVSEPLLLAVEVPACKEVERFGNGQTCSALEPTLAACGASPSRLCAGGWLCYESAASAECACQTDADCAGKREYVNTARAAADKAPVAVTCRSNRCVEGQ